MDSKHEHGTSNESKMLLGVFAYLGPLVIISFLMGKDNPFVKFHIKQGLILFVIEIIVWFISSMFYPFWMILNIVNLALFIFAIIGIINVVQNKEKELPFIGHFSKKFNF